MDVEDFFENEKVAERCHILSMLLESAEKKHVSFHTPGHKIGKFDITELSYSDNLSSPTGAIQNAEKDVAEILGADRSFFLTDGSTAGVYAMLYAVRELGAKKILSTRSAHQSFFRGCELLSLTPVLLEETFFHGKPVFPALSKVLTALQDCDAVFLTSPDYYGSIPPLKEISERVKKTGKYLLIDGAHGGHLHFQSEKYAGTYADFWVDGVHKSLPALTQGAIVSAKTADFTPFLERAIPYFRTTSPSYPILASIEYAVKTPYSPLPEIYYQKLLKSFPQTVFPTDDPTKIVAYFGNNAFPVKHFLEQKGLFPEFCDGENLMFYSSFATDKKSFVFLTKLLKKAVKKFQKGKNFGLLEEIERENDNQNGKNADAETESAEETPDQEFAPSEQGESEIAVSENADLSAVNGENAQTAQTASERATESAQNEKKTLIHSKTKQKAVKTLVAPTSGEENGKYTDGNLSPETVMWLNEAEKARQSHDGVEIEEGVFEGYSSARAQSVYGASEKNGVLDFGATRGEKTEWVDLESAVGRISAKNVGLFPPCLPVVLAGEVITKRASEKLQNALHSGGSTFGLNGEKISVFSDEEPSENA